MMRAQAQRSFAAGELEQISAELLAAGPGIRNAMLNRAALRLGHFVGAGALDRADVEKRLSSAARRIGLSAPEARATIRSGLQRGIAEPAFAAERESAPQERFVDWMPQIIGRLAELCPLSGLPEVAEYLEQRGIPTNFERDVFALPPAPLQGGLIAILASDFSAGALASTGLIRRLPSGKPDLSRFAWPGHRLCVIWRWLDGTPQTLQRRHVGAGECQTRWVFPSGRGPEFPLGYDRLEREEPGLVRLNPPRTVVIVEGPTDWLASRWIAARDVFLSHCDEADMPLVVALPSAIKLRPEWLRALAKRHVIVALDGDEAGEKAAASIINQLAEPALVTTTTRLLPPRGAKDWADTLVHVGGAASRQWRDTRCPEMPSEAASMMPGTP
jgi:hypothetical protein